MLRHFQRRVAKMRWAAAAALFGASLSAAAEDAVTPGGDRVASVGSATKRCAEPDIVQRYLALRGAEVPLPQWVLALNHLRQTWALYAIDSNPPAVKLAPLKVAIDGVPQLERGETARVTVLITETNPVLYSAAPLPGSQRDVPGLADLQTFARLAGGALGRALQVAGTTVGPKELGEAAGAREAVVASQRTAGMSASPPAPPPDVKALLVYVQKRLANIGVAVDPVRKALETLKGVTDRLEKERLHAVWYVQSLETGPLPTGGKWMADRAIATLVEEAPAAFRSLEEQLAALKKAPCVKPYAALRDATALLLDPIAPSATAAATARFLKQKEVFRSVTEADCPALLRDGSRSEVEILHDAAEWLTPFDPIKQPQGADRQLVLELHDAAAVYEAAATAQGTLAEDAEKLLAGNAAASKLAASLNVLLEREQARHAVAMFQGCANGGVLELPEPPDPYDWDKINVHKLTVVADAPGAADVVRTRTDVKEGRYDLAPLHKVRFVVGFGGIWTNVHDESYGPVSVEGKGTQKFIGRLQEDSMAGRPAVFLTLTRPSTDEYGLDLGAALSTDKPAFFVGVSFKFFQVARLGGGISWHEVNRLAADQRFVDKIGGALDPESLTPITEQADIRTRKAFAPGGYLNLTFTVPSLPFFRPKD